jgi:hypothetical protein
MWWYNMMIWTGYMISQGTIPPFIISTKSPEQWVHDDRYYNTFNLLLLFTITHLSIYDGVVCIKQSKPVFPEVGWWCVWCPWSWITRVGRSTRSSWQRFLIIIHASPFALILTHKIYSYGSKLIVELS